MDFNCVQDCSQCCIEREYYPSKKFGKIGVLILPEEKEKIHALAKARNLDVSIVPRIGISYGTDKPDEIIAYQMMGVEKNGNTCPFLDTSSGKKSPHGGFPCSIYGQRPLACMAYPLSDTDPITLDSKCKFCQNHGNASGNLANETEALIKIKTRMTTDAPVIWRYATGVGEAEDRQVVQKGWIMEA
ncbi:MAG TPA: YkgJ family cysteine cluster protein [Candidatus Nitrosotenuis sp.]|nr:YkgJ family cysteine cluster protein [Candidatus Nitrosotenuis sp.]